MRKQAEGAIIFGLGFSFIALIFIVFLIGAQQVSAEDPALFEADLSFNQTSSGEDYCALSSDRPFNLSVYYNTSGLDQGVTIQRMYRPDGVWRDIKEYTANTETIEDFAPNGVNYFYRAKYTGTNGGCHVRIDQ